MADRVNDDTIRTRAVNVAKRSPSRTIAWAISIVSTVITLSIAYGHRQANGEMQAKDFQSLKSEVQQMHDELIQVKESQARTEGTLGAISLWAQGVAKFQTSVQEGAKEALATPVPKLAPAHRAHK